jgi:amino acid transporter
MFADVPAGTFPAFLTRRDEHGTHHQALWTQAGVVCVLILLPLFSILTGLSGSDQFISLLNDLSSLAIVVPYLFISVAYVRARRAGMDAPFKMVRSTRVAVAIGVLTFVVSALGYLGAGLYALQAETIDWIYVATVYLGPGILIGLGWLLRRASLARARAARQPA